MTSNDGGNIKNLAGYDGDDRVISAHEMSLTFKEKDHFTVNLKSGIPSLDYYCEGFRDGELITISGKTKNGKCHGKGTMILMYDGSLKAVEDIVAGDCLMGDDSTPRKVQSTTKGFGKLYRISTNGGTPYICNEDHILCLWRTRTMTMKRGKPYYNSKDNQISELSVKEYRQLSGFMKHVLKAYRVPVTFQHQPISIDPYILGLWIGDGSSNGPEFTTADEEIADYIQAYCCHNGYQMTVKDQPNNKSKVYRICDSQKGRKGSTPFNRFKELLKEYGLLGNKHIPLQYKANTRYIRMQLLAGLIDTDGNSVPAGTLGNAIEIVTKHDRLADDILYLARSLGFAATKRKVIKTIKSIGFSGEYYNVRLNGETSEIPCLLKRKLFGAYTCKKNVMRSAFTVEYVEDGDYYGFCLDGNGRYLLSDFQVTHNTLLAQSLTQNFVEHHHPPLWFSFEVPPRQFLSQFERLPFIYMPSKLKAHAMDWIEERIMESFAKYNTRVVFIDHLHYLFDIQKSRNPSLDIGAIIRKLKGIAVNNEFVIFLLCHTSKAKDENESYESIRDSSFVAQESDCVIMVKRTPEEGDNFARARVEFHRRTGVMEKVIFLQKVGNYLVERAQNPGECKPKTNGRYNSHDND
jgi:replicative DNA helicase